MNTHPDSELIVNSVQTVNMDLAFLLDYLYLVTVAHHQTPYGCEEEFVPASVEGALEYGSLVE